MNPENKDQSLNIYAYSVTAKFLEYCWILEEQYRDITSLVKLDKKQEYSNIIMEIAIDVHYNREIEKRSMARLTDLGESEKQGIPQASVQSR